MWTCGGYGSRLRMRTSDPRNFQIPKFNMDFLVQSYICDKMFMKIRSVFPEIWAKLWKMPYLVMLKNPPSEANDVQN